jgi:hypothetical protein
VIDRYVKETPNREREGTYWHPRATPLVELTVNDLLEHALDIPPARWDRGSQMRVAKSLQALGWHRSRRRDGERRYWAYIEGTSHGE